MTSGPYGDAANPPEYPTPPSGPMSGPREQTGYSEQPYSEQPYSEHGYSEQPYGTQPYSEQPYSEQGGYAAYQPPPYPGQAYGTVPGYDQPPMPAPPGTYPYPGGYAQPQPRNGMGTAGLVLGIIGIVLCWTLWVGWVLNALAIIFGGVGIARANHGQATNKGSAVAGLVLGIIGLAIGLGILVLLFSLGVAWMGVTGSSGTGV